ncbi:MAG: peptide-methionine (R)-S-oxide reductase MsrB [Pseudomonadota bacterium]|nr:peptide-methionine (R)-S-oxide reductase MsrB [Pseudomonadota bacterium]
MIVTKRTFLASAAALVGGLAIGGCSKKSDAAAPETFEVTKSPDQWRAILTPAQYKVLRGEGTEPSRSSPLNAEKRPGTYVCAGCQLPVYSSETKFESGTGWPSFTAPIENAVRTKPDPGLFGTRTEVHCRRCGGHLGHVFDDGPPPTGQRWCMNGIAMEFVPA